MLRARWILSVVASLVALTGFLWCEWKRDEPRRNCIQTLQTLSRALDSSDSASLLQTVVLPQAIANRTAAEQTEFLAKALRDEISPGGLAGLQRRGHFGALRQLFPGEADRWAKQAGVNPDDCLAFKMDRAGLRAEVVLVHEGQTFRILRCNNVRQMAQAKDQL